MSRGGRGGFRGGGRPGGVEVPWEFDPDIKPDYKPSELFPVSPFVFGNLDIHNKFNQC